MVTNPSKEPRSSTYRRVGVVFLAMLTVLTMAVAPAAASHDSCTDASDPQKCHDELVELDNTFTSIGDIVVLIVVALAVPNGAYGFLEWMTANDSVEKDDRGRKRIRNTFIALGGVGAIRILVEIVKLIVIN